MSEPKANTQTAGCVIKHDDQYLMIQEKNPKAYGLWNMPAGHVDKGETAEQAAVREAKEETGFDVELDGLIDIFIDGDKLRHAFRAHIVGGELDPRESEILDVKWLSFEDINVLNADGKIRAPWIYEAIKAVEEA